MRTHRTLSRSARDERGAALVEFALIIPLFVVLLFAVLHFGRAFTYWLDETHLANQGARWVVVNRQLAGLSPTTCAAGGADTTLATHLRCQAVTEELRDGQPDANVAGPDGMDVSICFPSGTSNVGDPVRVTVTTTWDWTSFIPLVDIIGDAIDTTTELEATATMRLEQVPTRYTAEAGACA